MNEYWDYLAHHGIKGQQWGVQNGPPYPLDSSVSTGKRLKTESLENGSILKRKKRKETSESEPLPKRSFETQEEKMAYFNSMNKKQASEYLIKNADKMNNTDMQYLLSRVTSLSNVEKLVPEKTTFLDKVEKGSDIVNKLLNVYNTYDRVKTVIEKNTSKDNKLTSQTEIKKYLKDNKTNLSAKEISDLLSLIKQYDAVDNL